MRLQPTVLSILVVLFAAVATHAEPSPQNSAERMQQWRGGLLDFVAKHPDLVDEQIEAIQKLGDLDPGFFAPVLDADKRDLFAKRLTQLGRVLSHQDYLQVLRSLNENVRVWLVDNKLASLEEANKECNCSNWWDCNGNACQDVTCTHVGGTSHKGRCTGTEAEF